MFKMTKEEKKELFLTTIVCLIPLIAGIILYSRLPERIATHWDAQGNVNGTSSKFVGVIVLPGILVIINLLLPLLLRLDPKYENMSGRLKAMIHWLIPIIELFCSGITLASAMGIKAHVEMLAPIFVGVVFILTGNYLPKTKQSYTVGIKIPWTLNSEENWNHTHRLAGFLWVIGGLIMIVSSFFSWRIIPFFIVVVIIVIVPCVYSYLYYCKELKRNR